MKTKSNITPKVAALAYLRFVRQLPFVATEVGAWNADVLGISSDVSIEIETKISISDLRADFKNKKSKHFLYDKGYALGSVPNYFYFMVPEELAKKTAEIVTEAAPRAGVLTFTSQPRKYISTRDIWSVHKASAIHNEKPSAKIVSDVAYRMASELVALHLKLSQITEYVAEEVKGSDEDLAKLYAKIGNEEWDSLTTERRDWWLWYSQALANEQLRQAIFLLGKVK